MKAIVIKNGTVQMVDDPQLRGVVSPLGMVTKTRASHVVPVNPIKRVAFRALRALASDTSRVSGWTRKWKGPWVSDLSPSGGPCLGPFPERGLAIQWEIDWLNANLSTVR